MPSPDTIEFVMVLSGSMQEMLMKFFRPFQVWPWSFHQSSDLLLTNNISAHHSKMSFSNHQTDFSTINEKYENFKVSLIFYDVIHSKLEEVEADLKKISEIRDWLAARSDTDEKCSEMLDPVDSLEAYLEMTVEAVKERIELLEAVKESLEDESDDGYFERNYCTPHSSDEGDD